MSITNGKSDGRFISGLFFKVLPAQIFLLMLTGINNMVDGLVGSNFLGTDAMSTIGLYSPFQLIWVACGTILVVGSQVLCARYMGAGDLNKTRGVFSLDLTVAATITLAGTLISFALSSPIAGVLGATPAIADDLSGYIIVIGYKCFSKIAILLCPGIIFFVCQVDYIRTRLRKRRSLIIEG